ncbi:MAG: hypothetical protein M0R48_00830 [Candidatus Omnitrophica bacterium]|jgi:hypothetical protein|nr:hypothetical protein [Candidatus Omnitrophota bacterium]
MLGFILLPTFIVMLCVIGFHEGWKKVLKILGLWLGSFVLMAVIETAFGIKAKSPTFNVISLLLWGLWIVGLIIYNVKEGHIGKF